MDTLLSLPDELLLRCLSLLDDQSLLQLSASCHRIALVAADEWRARFRAKYPSFSKKQSRRLMRLAQCPTGLVAVQAVFSPEGPANSKQTDKFTTEVVPKQTEMAKSGIIRGWKFLCRCRSVLLNIPFVMPILGAEKAEPTTSWRFFQSHEASSSDASLGGNPETDIYPNAIAADDSIIVAASSIYPSVPSDPSILFPEHCLLRIWDRKTNAPIQTIKTHRITINNVILTGGWIVTCSYDQSIHLFQRRNVGGVQGKIDPVPTFVCPGHVRSVTSIKLLNGSHENPQILSGSKDHSIRLFSPGYDYPLQDNVTHELICTLPQEIRDIAVLDSQVFAGCGEHSASLIDIETKEIIHTYDTKERVYCVGSSNSPYLVSVGCDQLVLDFDTRTGKVARKYEQKKISPRQLYVDDERKICADLVNGHLYFIDQTTNMNVSSIRVHKSRCAFHFDEREREIITCGADRFVKRWSFPSTEEIVGSSLPETKYSSNSKCHVM